MCPCACVDQQVIHKYMWGYTRIYQPSLKVFPHIHNAQINEEWHRLRCNYVGAYISTCIYPHKCMVMGVRMLLHVMFYLFWRLFLCACSLDWTEFRADFLQVYRVIYIYVGFCAGMIFFGEMEQGGHSLLNWYLASCVSHSRTRAAARAWNAANPPQDKELILEKRDGRNWEKGVKHFRGKTELFS